LAPNEGYALEPDPTATVRAEGAALGRAAGERLCVLASVLRKNATRPASGPSAAFVSEQQERAERLRECRKMTGTAGAAEPEAHMQAEVLGQMRDLPRVRLDSGPSVRKSEAPTVAERAAAATDPAWCERLAEHDVAKAVRSAPRMRIG